MRAKRLVIGAAICITLATAAASVALWLLLVRWVPTEGKRRLIQELEQRWPVTVSIGQMRYGLLRGLMLENVRVTGRDTREAWCVIPSLQLHIGRLALLKRRIAFRGRVSLDVPCPTHITLSGTYSLRDRFLSLDGQTGEVPLRSVTAPLARQVPSELTDGAVRLQFHLMHSPQERVELAGRINGTGLVWTAPTWRMRSDLSLTGTFLPPALQGSRWAAHADVRLSHGSFEAALLPSPITRMEGAARLTEDGLEVEELSGILLGSPWRLEGALTFKPARMEVLLTGRQQLAALAEAFPAAASDWHPDGTAALRAVCRGSLGRRPLVDCQTRADVRDATVKATKLMEPLTNVSGTMLFDVLTRRLSIDSLSGRLHGEPLALNGTADLRPAGRIALHASGSAPLEALAPWLSPTTPVGALAGKADFDLDIAGTATPDITLVARFPQGELQLAGRATPEALVIEESRLSLEKSRLTVQGRLSRTPARPSTLSVSGTVELAELTTIPFLPLPALEPWALRGAAEVQGEFQGRLDDWRSGSLRARVRAVHLQARQLPLEQLVCVIEQRGGALRIQIPSALFADGKLEAELTVTQMEAARQDVLIQADLIGMALDRLAQVIPAWRDRSVTGRASAHAALSGTWQAPESWNGEGWLKADGERLGDVPLLDKLFRGLFGVLADRLGLDMLRRAQITSVAGRWQLARQRIGTEDLRLGGVAGMEPVAVYAKGSIGLDRTLDFVIEPELSEGVLMEAPTTSTLAHTVLKAAGQLERLRRLIGRHRLTGTLNEPVYRFEFSTQEIFKQLAPGPADLLQGLLDAVR